MIHNCDNYTDMQQIPIKTTAFFCLMLFLVFKIDAQPGGSISFQSFYDNLAPYGQWIDDPQYGSVWSPSVDRDFRPYYTNGHWVMTDYGNMWASDYTWGWAPFHYGRWIRNFHYGWLWIPDTEWGPAWVSWRSNANYYGWAPLAPGITVAMSYNNYYPDNDWWIFIPTIYIHNPGWRQHYYQGRGGNGFLLQHSNFINNTYVHDQRTYLIGPRAEEVRRVTHENVSIFRVQNQSEPGRGYIKDDAFNVYRPSVERSGRETIPHNNIQRIAPSNNPKKMNAGGPINPKRTENNQPSPQNNSVGRDKLENRRIQAPKPSNQQGRKNNPPPKREKRN
jgi:hypothetical protein